MFRRGGRSTAATGRAAEDRAARALEDAGYHVVERNFRCKVGELDIVAREGDVLVFVEVRARSATGRGTGLEAIGAAKQRKVAQVAEWYLAARKPRFRECRFDVVGITGDELVIVRDAFRLG